LIERIIIEIKDRLKEMESNAEYCDDEGWKS
jgi:hypothetical protein